MDICHSLSVIQDSVTWVSVTHYLSPGICHPTFVACVNKYLSPIYNMEILNCSLDNKCME